MKENHQKCLLCNSKDLIDLDKYQANYLVRCRQCNFVFAKKIPSQKVLFDLYSSYTRNDNISPITIKRYEQLLSDFEKFRKTNNIIDVGAGNGHFAATARKYNWNSYATEFDEIAVRKCQEKGVIVHQGKISANNYQKNNFDIITSFEVIEHINNPIEEVLNMREILRPGGLVYVTTPNFNSISRFLLGNNWHDVITYPEHLSYYTPLTITKLFETNGFKKISILTDGFLFSRSFKVNNNSTASNKKVEELRKKTETKFAYRILKAGVNSILNILKAGDAMKVMFVKI